MQFVDYATKASSLIAAAPRGAGYPRSVAATFDLAIAEAVAQCQAAEALMAYLAHCAPERIPMTLVEGAIEDEPERLQALAALSEVSLVRPDPFEDGTPAVTVHRLVQAAARAQSKTNGLAKDAIGRLIARLVAIYPGAASDVCSQLTPHLLARREADRGNALEVAGWPLVLEKAGYHFHGLGAYSEAVPFLGDALAIYERRLGPEHRDTARTLNNLALTLAYQGDYAGARPTSVG
jgi:Tetratricopeptide repeat